MPLERFSPRRMAESAPKYSPQRYLPLTPLSPAGRGGTEQGGC
jgi:hypothetical protein